MTLPNRSSVTYGLFLTAIFDSMTFQVTTQRS
eukprot:COSAG05_NODE_60_length_23142_cov_25.372130_11_plen_32_part_00